MTQEESMNGCQRGWRNAMSAASAWADGNSAAGFHRQFRQSKVGTVDQAWLLPDEHCSSCLTLAGALPAVQPMVPPRRTAWPC